MFCRASDVPLEQCLRQRLVRYIDVPGKRQTMVSYQPSILLRANLSQLDQEHMVRGKHKSIKWGNINIFQLELIVPDYLAAGLKFAKILHQIVGEGVVVVYD